MNRMVCEKYEKLNKIYKYDKIRKINHGGTYMNLQQEYGIFRLKLLKNMQEVKREFDNLSDENQRRFVNDMNAFLASYGLVITLEDLRQKRWLMM